MISKFSEPSITILTLSRLPINLSSCNTNRNTINHSHFFLSYFTDSMTIPSDIVIFEILTRLPVKSLLRFRCVSKQWRSVITDLNLRWSTQEPLLYSAGRHHHRPPTPKPKVQATKHHFHHPTPTTSTITFSTLQPLHQVNLPEFRFNFTTEFINSIICLYGSSASAIQAPEFDSCSSFGFDPSTNTYTIVRSWYHCHASPCNHSIFFHSGLQYMEESQGWSSSFHSYSRCVHQWNYIREE